MKIYLFLSSKLLSFTLPIDISGSYTFDADPFEESKLINVEARGNEWVLYSTEEVELFVNNQIVKDVVLEKDSFYLIRRDNKNYLIFVTESFDSSFSAYSILDGGVRLTIANKQDATIRYDCQYLSDTINISTTNGYPLIEQNPNSLTYINGKRIYGNKYYVQNGDRINIFGLRLIFVNNLLLINNPGSKVTISEKMGNVLKYTLPAVEKYVNQEIRDEELYSEKDYFSKSPRIVRDIDEEEVEFSAAPSQDNEQEMSTFLTIAPMLTMGMTSVISSATTVTKLMNGEVDFADCWPTIVMAFVMLLSMLLWPTLIKRFEKKKKEKKKQDTIKKYNDYLKIKEKQLEKIRKDQETILKENLVTTEECHATIQNKTVHFWDKRIDYSDFLKVRVGMGNEKLKVNINYPEEGFSADENELKDAADKLVEKYKYIYDVPIGYSFFENKVTGILSKDRKGYYFLNNMLLQLFSFYSYDDLKVVVLTNEFNKSDWDYLRYSNYNFSNNKTIRYFASNPDDYKRLTEYFNSIVGPRISSENGYQVSKPYFLVIIDDYSLADDCDFVKAITECEANLGFSIILLGSRLNDFPSKCSNFIHLKDDNSTIISNSYEKQETTVFKDEINYRINMMSVTKILSNIPIAFESMSKGLPESISFMEMEKVGKVNQLNILNRWRINDSTTSLRAEVGVGGDGDLMYLDLHEKFHGPHGLIAGMTGSGKSEFIITYILSMCINYSPDDVAFILIDYKGGGLAGAFENKVNNIVLPHLAGTITNLDKAEMDRTLVSIDSELKRRQSVFNEARDKLGESTIDIYKYQRFYKDGRLEEAIPHLFIICDEFAELKSQQPDFMESLISTARIGRSLGVHLILATQKPSGVVNDQIWSNTKFRVCLKVQDASDSREMLKRDDAASLKEAGRFYLQVGYDEYFALGQSAWCGAKYYPSEKIIKTVDKSVNFIDNTAMFIKSIQANNEMKVVAQGDQIGVILRDIIDTAARTKKKARRLWLENIPETILVSDLMNKYQFDKSKLSAVIGEYDAPEMQEQGLLSINLPECGNFGIYGNDGAEREQLLSSILYSLCSNYSAKDINIYGIDFGSESTRNFLSFPQVGGIVYNGDDEVYKSLIKFILGILKTRKQLLVDYGGSFDNYNARNTEKLPVVLFFINNFEAVTENYQTIQETLEPFSRECARYGIILSIASSTPGTIGRRIYTNFLTNFALHFNDNSSYFDVFNMKVNVDPRDYFARGVCHNLDDCHEFQTASIVDATHSVNEHLNTLLESIDKSVKAPKIPTLPAVVTMEEVPMDNLALNAIPVGIGRNSLKPVLYDFTQYSSTTISGLRINNTYSFVDSLVTMFTKVKNLHVIFIDLNNQLPSVNRDGVHYMNDDFDNKLKAMLASQEEIVKRKDIKAIYILMEANRASKKIEDISLLNNLVKSIKESENTNMIFVDTSTMIKSIDFENWYSDIKNNSSGIWVGRGVYDQATFRINRVTKEMQADIGNNYGYIVSEGESELTKLIEFNDMLEGDDEFE